MKKRVREDFHICVEPLWWGHEIEQRRIELCEEMAKSIRRHVDDVHDCSVSFTTRYVCSHCGYEWEDDPETGEPCCCAKAQEEWATGKVEAQDDR